MSHIHASEFCKNKWNTIRVKSGKFLTEDRPGPDDCQNMAKSDRVRSGGDPAFGDAGRHDGLASVVPKRVK